ncbi:MAG: S8 family serine peptidase [Candidatus Thorarchaeota archaeon]
MKKEFHIICGSQNGGFFNKRMNRKPIVGCILILLFQISIAASYLETPYVSKNDISFENNASTTLLSGNSSDFESVLAKDPNRFSRAKIISSEINQSYAKIVVRKDNEGNESKIQLMSSGVKAYQMVNYDRSQNWLDMISMPRYGEGVTVALTGCGVYPHDDIKRKPDETLRHMWYIDINWYKYYVGIWPFGYWQYAYEASNTYINTESEWTTYSDYSHDPDFKVGIYDGSNHGTPVTGALLKMAPYVDLVWVDFNDFGTTIDEVASAWGLELLHAWGHDPDIISASWGEPSHYSGWDDPINDLLADGTTVFIAGSGNDGGPIIYYPAKLSNVMSVGAVNTRDEPDEGIRPSWSGYGPDLDVTSPGNPVYTPSEGGGYSDKSGTSFSTPIVAGQAAQVYQTLKNIRGSKPSRSTVVDLIKYHCDPGGQDTSSYDYDATYSRQNNYYGHGITDA